MIRNNMKTTKNKIIYEKDITGLNGKSNIIVYPDNYDEVQNLVRLSNADLIPRAGGTSFSGATSPDNSIIIDMSKMNRLIYVDTLRKSIYVEAGAIVADINNELERFGLEFPILPLFPGIQTIGGLIATNSSSQREIKYGRIRNWVDSLEIVNGKAELIQVPKSDSSEFIGMEGTTGIIMRAKLRLTTKKNRSLSVFKSESLVDLLKLNKNLRLDRDISMLQLFGKKLSKLLGLEEKYHLFAEFEGDKGKMKGDEYTRFMKLKNKAYFRAASGGNIIIEDPRIFIENFDDILPIIEEDDIPYFCNSGSGTIYCFFKKEDNEKKKDILSMVKKLRGRVSDSLGIGLTKKEYLDKGDIELIKRIKTRHDPQWKFNQGKLVDYSPEEIKNRISEKSEQAKQEIKIEDNTKKIESIENTANNNVPDSKLSASSADEKSTEQPIPVIQNPNKPEMTEEETNAFTNPRPEKEISESERKFIKKLAGGAF